MKGSFKQANGRANRCKRISDDGFRVVHLRLPPLTATADNRNRLYELWQYLKRRLSMRITLTLALLVALLAVGTAGAAKQADTTPPVLTATEDMTGAEFYIDGETCVLVDVGEDATDDLSGVHWVMLGLASENDYDTVIHDYTGHGDGGVACLRKPGKFSVSDATTVDMVENRRSYSLEEMKAGGFHSTFWVYKESSRAAVPPKLFKKTKQGKRTGTPAALAADDDSYVTVASRRNGTDWTSVFAQVPNWIEHMAISFKGKSDVPCLNRLYARNFYSHAWELLDERMLGPDEVEIRGLVPGTPGNLSFYITNEHGPGFVWVRNTCEAGGAFVTSTDVLTIDWRNDW